MKTELQIFDPLVQQVTEFVAPAGKIKVTDHITAQNAIDTAKKVKDYQKRIETLRKQLVEPLNARVKEINAYAGKVSEPLEKVEKVLKDELVAFNAEQERLRAAEIARVEQEQHAELERINKEKLKSQKGVKDADKKLAIGAMKEAEAQSVNTAAKNEIKSIESTAIKGVRKTWKAELISEAEVPREYLTVDMKKVNLAVKSGTRSIPGIRIFEDSSISLGATTAVPEAAIANDYFTKEI